MWARSGNIYQKYGSRDQIDVLERGIYTLKYGPFNSTFLERDADEFKFPYKLYGRDGFPERVIKAYRAGNSNLGVLLSGLKGTGKTVQAEQICNFSGLPVILVTQAFGKNSENEQGNVALG